MTRRTITQSLCQTLRRHIALLTLLLVPLAAIAIKYERGTYATTSDAPYYTNGVEYICTDAAGCTIPANNTTCVETNGGMYMQSCAPVGGGGSISIPWCYTTTVTGLVDGGDCMPPKD